jgi:hypothetical protein
MGWILVRDAYGRDFTDHTSYRLNWWLIEEGLALRVLTIMVFVTFVFLHSQESRGEDHQTAQCWNKWDDFQMREVPKGSDLVSPATGKEMSETDGAKRTHDL